MIGRRLKQQAAAVQEVEEPELPAGPGKNRPTPKRSDARAARELRAKQTRPGAAGRKVGPLPTDPKERKAAVKQLRREQFDAQRVAMKTGDESNLPAQHAGPERKRARQLVDARPTAGYVLFGAYALLLVSIGLPKTNAIGGYVSIAEALFLLGGGLYAILIARSAVRQMKSEGLNTRGLSFYAFTRAALPPRFRRPPPVLDPASVTKPTSAQVALSKRRG